MIKDKLRPGGLLLIDNMLWHGRVFDPTDRTPSTEAIREFTRRLQQDPDFVFQLIPIRDGLIAALRLR